MVDGPKSFLNFKVSEVAGQLQAVMQKNPRKARPSCTKEYRAQKARDNGPNEAVETQGASDSVPAPEEAASSAGGANDLTGGHAESAGTMMVWEISDSDDEPVADEG